MRVTRWWPVVPAVLLAVVVSAIGAREGMSATAARPSAQKLILFASDGMRPDLAERYAAEGAMPTFAGLLASGVKGSNGLVQGFPPNTGVGWNTLATGTYPSEFGTTNNTFYRSGADFRFGTSGFAPGLLQADTILQAAERAGKTVVAVEWVGARNQGLAGPVVDFRSFHSARGVTTNYVRPSDDPSFISIFRLDYDVATLDPAAGWSNAPVSYSPALETVMKVRDFGVERYSHNVYVYDSTDNGAVDYDRALLVRAPSKDGSSPAATLGEGEWADIKLPIVSGPKAGKTAGMLVKLEELSDDASRFRLYHTSVTRVQASYSAQADFEDVLAEQFPTSTAADFAPLEAGIISEDTYVEQGLKWRDAHSAYLDYIVDELDVKPDLLALGNPVTDEFSHQFMGLVTPTDLDGAPNPYYDDADGDGVTDGRLSVREGYIRSAYAEADQTLALGRSLMGEGTAVFATSDHGFAPQWYAVNARKVLFDASVDGTSLHASGATAVSNCAAAADDLAKACWAGGTIQVYVNPTLPSGTTYAEVRDAAAAAFRSLSDPANPGKQVVDRVLLKEELRDVDGSDSLHPNRSGDVVVVLRPPYQSDAGSPGERIAFSHFFGQHGYAPDLVALERNVNMHGTFVAAGPGIASGSAPLPGVRAIDVAPTAAFLLGIPGPQNARGRILYEALAGAGSLREVTILNISDYHGQLPPLSERSDSFGPRFGLGGAAFLKPWLDLYRREARDGSITVAGGDSIGATPPISSFFGDKPTIEVMNALGFDADAIGNHNFDKGERYFREEIVPLAKFKYVSANILDGKTGDTPEEWSKSRVFDFGFTKLGLVGFSNPDIAELTFPGSLGPFVVGDPLAAVNKRAEQLGKRKGVGPIVAVGHLGASGGTVSSPIGPVVDLADGVKGVQAVIGDHTGRQVLTVRPNGVLVTENRSKGAAFTRVRLVVDTATNTVVYATADFHLPWNIGVTPDAAIQRRIDELNAQLSPILGQVVGNSTVAIPRAGPRESLEGNVVTDAMRRTYGVDFAITNTGGLRAELTCPETDNPDDFCPAYTPPPYPITRGQVQTVMPFGNAVVTLTLNGAELKTMLENGVSQTPVGGGRFPQVSGLCFTYDASRPSGARVVGAARQAADGTCTGGPVDLTAASTYTLAENDFMASGGDGYPNFSSRMTTRDVMDQVVADWIAANTPISPALQGRVTCTGAGCP